MATQGYEQNYCQICKKLLPVDEFLLNNQGKRNKTCKRHSKKRPLQIDDWDEFIKLIRKWNRPDQHETLNASYTFSLDALPVVPDTHYPPKVADALRKALYYTEVNLQPQKALQYYREALALCKEEGLPAYSDEVIGIKLKVVDMFVNAGLYKPAVNALDRTIQETTKFINGQSELQTKSLKELLTLEDIPVEDRNTLDFQEANKEALEFRMKQRPRLVKKVIGLRLILVHIPLDLYPFFGQTILSLLFSDVPSVKKQETTSEDEERPKLPTHGFLNFSVTPVECSVICSREAAERYFVPLANRFAGLAAEDGPRVSISTLVPMRHPMAGPCHSIQLRVSIVCSVT
ncbi:hypothetical protein VTN31DRAFT_5074 [Thermomyces dupontii]|uniref:uncharacterized protein n=1 Tax=Talaromyces thermophilus TaxID=28565 RepID=UPI0037433004